MADNTINIGLNVSSNGTLPKATAEAKELQKNLSQAEQTAARIGVQRPANQTAAFAASKRAESAPSARRQAEPFAESQDYGRARGTVGTGAGARDFAKQSEGLGGLVRLYATLAANVFAATAAFSALSNAMDTTNMVKGLDQLGAASGQSLGSLSKRIFQLTDGAISMREAMEATVKATSSGMGGKDLERLAIGAKQASQALGVNMSDAVSRLTRGITKLEPELLDELGIFVRVDDAAAKYAKTLGVSASSLTDVQRRAAFAAETLAQVESKFGAIQLDSNPFTKLAASLANLAQSGLEVVNKFIGPLAKVLAENTGLLATVIGAIGVKLVGSALPAIGAWRAGLRSAADDAAASAKRISESYGDNFQKKLEKSFKLPQLDRDLKLATQELDALQSKAGRMPAPSSFKKSATISAMSSSTDVTEKQAATLNNMLAAREKKIADIAAGQKTASASAISNTKAEISWLEKEIATYNALERVKSAKAARELGYEGAQTVADKPMGRLDPGTIAIREYTKAKQKADALSAVASVAEVTRIDGIRGAMSKLNAEIAEKGITGFTKYSTVAKGALVSVATRITGIIGSFGAWGAAAAAAFATFEIIDSIFSKNSKAVGEFKTAVEATNEAIASADRTLDSIAKKPLDQVLSVSSLKARTTALTELTTRAADLNTTLANADKTAGDWDKFWDFTFKIANKDLKSTFAKNMALTIESSLKALPEGKARTELQAKLNSILGTTKFDFTTLNNAIGSISTNKILETGNQLSTALTQASTAANTALAPIVAMDDAVNKAGSTFGELVTSLANSSDPITKFGVTMLDAGNAMAKAFESPATALSILNNIIKDTNKLSLLSPASRTDLLAASKDLQSLALEAGEYEKQLIALNKELAASKEKSEPLQAKRDTQSLSGRGIGQLDALKATEAKIESQIAEVRSNNKSLEERTKSSTAILKTLSLEVINKGLAVIGRELEIATSKAAIGVTRSIVSTMEGVGAATVNASLKTQEIDLQIQQVTYAQAMVKEQAATRLEQEKTNELLSYQIASRDAFVESEKTGSVSPETQARLKQSKDNLTAIDAALAYFGTTVTMTAKTLAKANLSPEAKQKVQGVSIAGTKAAGEVAALAGQKESIKTERDIAERKATEASQVRSIQSANTLKALETDKLRLMIAGSEVVDATLLARVREAEKTAVVAANTAKTRAIEFQISEQLKVIEGLKTKKASEKDQNAAAINLADKRLQLTEAQAEAEARVTAEIIRQGIVFLTNDQAKAKREQVIRDEQTRYNTEYETAVMDLKQRELDALISIGALSKSQAIERKTELELERVALEQKNALINKNLETEDKLRAVKDTAAKQKLAIPSGSEEDMTEISIGIDAQALAASEAIKASSDQYIANLIRMNELKKQGITLLSKEQAEMAKMEDLADTLAKAFGDVGTKLGGGLTAILKATQKNSNKVVDIEKSAAKKRKDIDNTLYDSRDDKIKDLAKLDRETNKERLENDLDAAGEMAGAAKSMFAEKTFAHKAFAAAEKAIHVVKLGMLIAELTAEGVLTANTVAGSIARTFVKGKEAVVTALNLPPPMGFIAGAAMAALVASIIGKAVGGGGGKAPSTAGVTAADKQETQGTGMSWVNGKKVENGRGVFGDAEAKSESIANGIEIMKDNMIEGLGYNKKMLKAMENIDKAVTVAGGTVLGARGVRQGTAFGSLEGETSKGGYGSSIPLVGGLLGGLLGGGKKVTTTILDAGLKLKGTFSELEKGISGSVLAFKDISVRTQKKGGLFSSSSDKTKLKTETEKASDAITSSIADIFSESATLFKEIGAKVGIAEGTITSALSSFDAGITISLKDLKGQDLIDELNSVISSILDDASSQIFSAFSEFPRKVGEGMLETVIRVVDGGEKVKVALDSIGVGIKVATTGLRQEFVGLFGSGGLFGVGGAKSMFKTVEYEKTAQQIQIETYKITEALIEGAGGLDRFTEQIESFRDNFMTEAQKLVAVQKNVTNTMAELGLSTVDTREEFAALIQAIDPANDAQRELYQSLMDISDAFAMVTPPLQEVMSAEDIRSKKLEMSLQILELEGRATEALAMTRADELKVLDSSLHAAQEYIWALEDASAKIEMQAELVGALGFTYDALMISREMELRSLTELEKIIKRNVYAAEDQAKTNGLLINLLEAEGKSAEALVYTRRMELNALSDGDASIQRRIYALQDESALKDKLKTAYDKESSAIKSVIDSMKGAIKTLNDYRLSLKQGDKSILTPAQKYEEAKSEAMRVAGIATGIATTEAEKLAQLDAIQKLPGVSDAFLAASRTMFASSEAYTTDYNLITGILDSTSSVLEGQKSTAELQLTELQTSVSSLKFIEENTQTAAELLKEYLATQTSTSGTSSALAVSYATSTLDRTTSETQPIVEAIISSTGAITQATTTTEAIISSTLAAATDVSLGVTESVVVAIESLAAAIDTSYTVISEAITLATTPATSSIPEEPTGASTMSVPIGTATETYTPSTSRLSAWKLAQLEMDRDLYTPYAKGGLASGLALVGEEGPELVNFTNPGMVSTAGATSNIFDNMNKTLVAELRQLRNEVAQLRQDQKQQTGHLITSNYDANMKAAEKVAQSTEEAQDTANWQNRSAVTLK